MYFVVNKEMKAWGPLNPFFEFKQTDLFTANAAHIFRIASTVRCEQICLLNQKNGQKGPSHGFLRQDYRI